MSALRSIPFSTRIRPDMIRKKLAPYAESNHLNKLDEQEENRKCSLKPGSIKICDVRDHPEENADKRGGLRNDKNVFFCGRGNNDPRKICIENDKEHRGDKSQSGDHAVLQRVEMYEKVERLRHDVEKESPHQRRRAARFPEAGKDHEIGGDPEAVCHEIGALEADPEYASRCADGFIKHEQEYRDGYDI